MTEIDVQQTNQFDFQMVVTIIFALLTGILITSWVLPEWLPTLSWSVLGADQKFYWYLSRSSAILSYVFLWLSMLLGLLLSNRLANHWLGGRITNDFHQFFSLFGLLFAAVHALVLLGDQYLNPDLLSLLAPFGLQSFKPFWVGLGQIGFYAWIAVILSFYLRKGLGQAAWRMIHYLSFILFVFVFLHGIFSGSDSSLPGMVTLYWVTAASFLFLVIFRVITKLFNAWAETSQERMAK